MDEYMLRVLGMVLKGPDYEQVRLYALAVINVFRNCLLFLLLIQVSYLGKRKEDNHLFKNIRLFVWPLLVYWILLYSFEYTLNNPWREFDSLFACSVFLYLSVMFSSRRPNLFVLPTEKPRQTVGYVLAVAAVAAYFFGLPYVIPYIQPSYTPPTMVGFDIFAPVEAVNAVVYSVVVACALEIFYRGILFGYLFKRANKVLAFIVAGLICSLFQYGDLESMAAAFLFSIIFSGLLLYSRNVYVPITAHFLIIFMSRMIYGVNPFTF